MDTADKVNILLVDDQPAKLLSYEVILGELGENLIKASTPHEALGILLKTDVAVVLIDVVMPQIDGFQLASMIREHPRFQKLAMIFVSGVQIADTDHLRGYEIGAVDYVAVPVVPEVLRAKVKVFVELYRKTRQLEALNAELEQRVAARTAELEAHARRLRASEDRRSIALSAGDMGSWEVDLATGNIEWDDGPYRIFGVDPATFRPTVDGVEAMMHPDDRARSSVMSLVNGSGPRFQVEFRIVRPNGELRWCYGAGIISRDPDGKPLRMTGVTVDVTERKRITAELEAQTERLRGSEERRSLALSAGGMGSWQFDVISDRLELDDGQYRIYGVDPAHFQPTRQVLVEMVHPDDRAIMPLVADLGTNEAKYQVEFRLVRPNGEIRWCYGSAAITRDADGRPIRLNGVSVDITERKRAEERQLLLAREVDHRAKNMLAVVLSILRLTRAKTTPEFVKTVEGRIQALAATHSLLSATRWEGANLRQIVDEELAPYKADLQERAMADGPPAMLLPATAQSMALALHELATNAAKYGALSTEAGRLRLHWWIGKEALELEWTETGGPTTSPPSSHGFGLTIVRSSIESQFRGGVTYDWRPEGLSCRLSIPHAQMVAPDEAKAAPPAKRAPDRPAGSLAGKRLLMVEDEFLVGLMAKRILEGFGAVVAGPYGRLADALVAAKGERFDGAVLDFNLAGETAEPLADFLLARGVPFAFLTGYHRDSIDRRYANIPLLQKPIDAESLERVLVSLLESPDLLEAADAD